MLCPFDATTLQVVNRSGVEIDWCPSCKGVWLERGELDKLIDLAASPAAMPPAAPSSVPASMPAPAGAPSAPPPHYAAPQPAEYRRDYDARDRDRDRDWRDDDDDDWDDRRKYGDGYRQKKRKNLLSEIFDF